MKQFFAEQRIGVDTAGILHMAIPSENQLRGHRPDTADGDVQDGKV